MDCGFGFTIVNNTPPNRDSEQVHWAANCPGTESNLRDRDSGFPQLYVSHQRTIIVVFQRKGRRGHKENNFRNLAPSASFALNLKL